MNKKSIVIGITGGIGSGKSVVSDLLEKKGMKIIRSDLLAKEVIASDPSVQKKIRAAFGNGAFVNGKLNSKFVADKVFTDGEKLKLLNSIVHPPVIKLIKKQIEEFSSAEEMIFVESALIYEAKIEKLFDYIILIYTDEETRIKRAAERDRLSEEEVRRRISLQMPDEVKSARAHFTIENNSTLENLSARLDFILHLIASIRKS